MKPPPKCPCGATFTSYRAHRDHACDYRPPLRGKLSPARILRAIAARVLEREPRRR